jgi:3-hydroxybenzoate 6-monooxygenase
LSVTRVPLLVIGGGIGGLAAALSIAQSGRYVHVIERASEFGEIGAGIQIAPNASRVLDRLGILEGIQQSAVFPERIVWMDMISGERLTHLDLGDAFRARYTYPYMVMHRSDLLDAILRAASAHPRITLENDRAVTTIVDCGDYMAVTCSNGSAYHADVLIAADGMNSRARLLLDPIELPQYDHFIAYRGTIPFKDISAHAGLDNLIMWTGPNRHFMQYPLRRGELYNQVAVFRSPNPSPHSDDWGGAAELDAAYADVCPQLQIGLKLIDRDKHWVMADRPSLPRWTINRMTLLGDAAHAMYQYAAQGACQAIEDAAALADSMTEHENIHAAFAAYESERMLRTARVQRTARWFGDTMHLAGSGAVFRNHLLRRREPTDYSPFDFLYGYGTEHSQSAKTIDDVVVPTPAAFAQYSHARRASLR